MHDVSQPAPETLAEAVAIADRPEASGLAEVAESAAEALHQDRYVLLSIASAQYAVLEAYVTELDRVPKITPVPRVPAWVRGVTNLRGDILSVIDMRTFLGFDVAATHGARLLVVRLLDEDFATGLIVDGVERIVSVAPGDIKAPESQLAGPLAAYVTGVCVIDERLNAVLDLERLLRSPEIRQFEEIEETPTDGEGAERRVEADKD